MGFPGRKKRNSMNVLRFKSCLTAKSITVRLREGNTKPDVVVPVVRVVVVPVDGTDIRRRIVPASAAYHAVSSRGRALLIHYYENSLTAQA